MARSWNPDMTEAGDTDDESPARSWLERLGSALGGEPRDRKEVVDLLRNAERRGVLDADSLAMIEGVMHVGEMQVRDVMISRSQMVVVERDAAFEQILPVLVESAHSRFPVIGENRDDVVGILLAKDLLNYVLVQEQQARFSVRELLRPAVFIPESKRLNVLLKDFRANRNHMAIVVDEFGGVAGLITIEDVLEQIVGEIDDEHDTGEEAFILPRSEGRYMVRALTPVEDFNEHFGADFSDEEFDTIGGVVTQAFGRLPNRGETVTLGRYQFKVLRADKRRIHLLQLEVLPAPEEDDQHAP